MLPPGRPADDGKDGGRVSSRQLAGTEKGAKENRDGLGTVYAISRGNGRFVIAVAAVNRDGEQSSYSKSGLKVVISALSQPPGVVVTTN